MRNNKYNNVTLQSLSDDTHACVCSPHICNVIQCVMSCNEMYWCDRPPAQEDWITPKEWADAQECAIQVTPPHLR
jgi:hypothetical protein